MEITRHYIDRYFERVLNTKLPDTNYNNLKQIVRKDMDIRMCNRQKSNLLFISGSGSRAKTPMGSEHSVVTQDNTAITVLFNNMNYK